ncbi:ArsR/SmtB family transcription factor [Pseudorhodoplanes sinuspersici]|uniref:Transcriptional regulator n=1 Tax=Pseudorhodoplanes sinuspersici TaxID=1235591 RepID=A0A1W6ZXJ4_9HYPH|nr:helix-turn-helix domain-containing protein [Pseudorhodoplanes sinuspersici]ARQ02102.1 transcriptional regulator [Pseudorhodoplanes sinuspersici]RKE73901.1 ArsR family transcriptional regulator [Pseudorhodoplanes sinuspersici]
MTASNTLAIVAACAGDPARASMLSILADGRAFTAGELSAVARVTPQTASGHLARMVDAGLLVVASQGRHRYYRLASPQVALMLESMMVVAAEPTHRLGRIGPSDERLRLIRTCYDHLAGRLAVGIADMLVEAGHLSLSGDGGELTDSGRIFLRRLGLDLADAKNGRPFCRPCLDWSERRHHLAGTLGARMMDHCLGAGWIKRSRSSRVVEVTPLGARKFRDVFGLRV